jgi:hypothetical protein
MAAQGTGYSPRTLDKVREVRRTAGDPAAPEPVRTVARKALQEMDATGKVDRPWRAVRASKAPDVQTSPPARRRPPEPSGQAQDARSGADIGKLLWDAGKEFSRSGDELELKVRRATSSTNADIVTSPDVIRLYDSGLAVFRALRARMHTP